MSGVIPPLPNTPPRHGDQLKHRDNFTFYLYLLLHEVEEERLSGKVKSNVEERAVSLRCSALSNGNYKRKSSQKKRRVKLILQFTYKSSTNYIILSRFWG
jgi:hypothetical protein